MLVSFKLAIGRAVAQIWNVLVNIVELVTIILIGFRNETYLTVTKRSNIFEVAHQAMIFICQSLFVKDATL